MAQPPPVGTPADNATRGPNVIAGSATVFALAALAVILRVLARKVKKIPLGLDDWLVISALPMTLVVAALEVYCVEHGLGRHINTVGEDDLIKFIKATYAIEVLWAASLLPVKLSILALYVRIFGSLRYMRVLTWVTAAYSIAWTIMAVLVLTLQCLPISKNWYMDLPGHCIDTRVFFFVGSALDLLVFFALLVLPIPPVWNLQSGFHERISVMGIFLIGSLVFVISIVRLIELILNQSTGPDPTWSSYQVALWSTAQPCLGIVCACLPTMTPLLKTVVGRGRPKARYYDTSVAAGHVESNSKGVKDDPYSSTGNLRNPHTFPSSRDPSYGFRAERSEQIPSELADIADTELARDMRVHGNVYALTTIDVEESRK